MRCLVLVVLLLGSGCLGSDAIVVTAGSPLLIEGYGYDGRRITQAAGQLRLRLDEASNTGEVVAEARDAFHSYRVDFSAFQGRAPFQSGGVVRNVDLWGATGNGSAVFPKIRVHVAAFGTAQLRIDNETQRDPTNLQERFNAIVFVTRGRYRDAESLRVEDAQQMQPYDPAKPQDAHVSQIGSQAVVLLFTQRGDLLRHFDYQDVRVRSS